ncbi:E75 [Cordylochernes scorpioides]|uniref:E75 n=1 Tax=Cordylochernes scorpioides TaxID=51811 RepID=A0ABY6KYQ5_9ARAC|nr:E75 [Cordylochernes scorpioides]
MTSILGRLLTSGCPKRRRRPTPPKKDEGIRLAHSPFSTDPLITPSFQPHRYQSKNQLQNGDVIERIVFAAAVRFGRVPKREKAKILAAMQKVNASSQEKALSLELEDEYRVMSIVVEAHEETCAYTKEKVAPLLDQARSCPVFAQGSAHMACPLNPGFHSSDNNANHILEEFSERFSPAILGVVEFAKRIPGFSLLAQEDQVTLLKAGVFEVLLVRLACMFDSHTSSLVCLNGQVLRRESLHSSSNARFLLDSMFDFAERLNGLRLTDNELGLFSSVVVISYERPGLRNVASIQKINDKLKEVLKKAVTAQHPENPAIFEELMRKIPDLKTLNTLHSEKLLAYKMEPSHQSNVAGHLASTRGTTAPADSSWARYPIMATLAHEEEHCPSSPGQHSAGSTLDWSTNDSKDGHDLYGSPHSVGSGLSAEEAKSPMRTSSFSSTRSSDAAWQGDMIVQTEVPLAKKDSIPVVEMCSSSGDELYYGENPKNGNPYPKIRRVDSPTDSGIESGKEHGPSITPTASVCSSPRSAMEEKVKDIEAENTEKQENMEDMPVLKRALQAPPLINTNMLMDEAYRHHKKFRVSRREAESPNTLRTLANSHSTLIKTLEQAPRYLSEQQLKSTDLIHNIIMRTEAVSGQESMAPQSPNYMYAITSHSNPPPSTLVHSSQSASKPPMVCPQGYFIPSSTSYTSSPPPSSWQFAIPSSTLPTPSRSPYRSHPAESTSLPPETAELTPMDSRFSPTTILPIS